MQGGFVQGPQVSQMHFSPQSFSSPTQMYYPQAMGMGMDAGSGVVVGMEGVNVNGGYVGNGGFVGGDNSGGCVENVGAGNGSGGEGEECGNGVDQEDEYSGLFDDPFSYSEMFWFEKDPTGSTIPTKII